MAATACCKPAVCSCVQSWQASTLVSASAERVPCCMQKKLDKWIEKHPECSVPGPAVVRGELASQWYTPTAEELALAASLPKVCTFFAQAAGVKAGQCGEEWPSSTSYMHEQAG